MIISQFLFPYFNIGDFSIRVYTILNWRPTVVLLWKAKPQTIPKIATEARLINPTVLEFFDLKKTLACSYDVNPEMYIRIQGGRIRWLIWQFQFYRVWHVRINEICFLKASIQLHEFFIRFSSPEPKLLCQWRVMESNWWNVFFHKWCIAQV